MPSKVAVTIGRWFIVPLALVTLEASDSFAAPHLFWKMELRSARSPVNGLSFEMYGAQRQLDFVLTFVNEDSEGALALPANFVQALLASSNDFRLGTVSHAANGFFCLSGTSTLTGPDGGAISVFSDLHPLCVNPRWRSPGRGLQPPSCSRSVPDPLWLLRLPPATRARSSWRPRPAVFPLFE